MRKRWCLWIVLGFAACTGTGSTVSVKTDSAGKELDTLGNQIEKKAEQVGDSVQEKLNDIKEAVNARMDSIRRAHHDKTH